MPGATSRGYPLLEMGRYNCWMEAVLRLIDQLFVFGITETLVVIAAICVLVDYFFPTDWPAHVGYVLFALATFFAADMLGLPPVASVLVGSAMWLSLALLHRSFLGQLLENATGTPAADPSDQEESA